MIRVRLLICFLFSILLSSCSGQNEKVNGVSFVAYGNPVDETHTEPVVSKINANFAAVMPFGFIRDISNPEIIHNTDRQWFGETRAGAKQYSEELRKQNIKIMVKPHIWIRRGEFTGFLDMKSEEDWKKLEETYTSFILEYADLAQEINAEIFCIGTELENFVAKRPKYWDVLINKIKLEYKGKLTYAANWDEYKHTPFWSKLDYIGIDAYFPVSDEQTPTFETSMKGWNNHKPQIKALSEQNQKSVLFTEYGYRSVDYAGKKPWVYDRSMTVVNMEAQVNTSKALYETFWKEDWFAGGFLWKWFIDYDKSGGKDDNQFTPQNKPVEKVIKNYYSAY
ncbi:glycoside hydrolase [Winogradskyella sp. PC-19]|uniref:glycoside hydrolase family 113 n=1 Tax=unclassified Winogradskyella TaxID=2615021 RepID=UPI000B3D4CCC|nr:MULTISPECIES: glycoside hydrolase [unclassified Winogradskyella]ARV10109.1 glycoside hydrolase [Winogradskyella sp. PC-19]RZN83556.1 MAG: glycoside hydrolase [Winogradskyella sp.]